MCKSVKIDKANRRIDLIIKYVRQANKKKNNNLSNFQYFCNTCFLNN